MRRPSTQFLKGSWKTISTKFSQQLPSHSIRQNSAFWRSPDNKKIDNLFGGYWIILFPPKITRFTNATSPNRVEQCFQFFRPKIVLDFFNSSKLLFKYTYRYILRIIVEWSDKDSRNIQTKHKPCHQAGKGAQGRISNFCEGMHHFLQLEYP